MTEHPGVRWFDAPPVAPVARRLLALMDPPDAPVEFRAFVRGARGAVVALSPQLVVRFHGQPVEALLENLASSISSEAGIRTQWHQDPLRGHGSSAYRAFAQPAAEGTAEGYATLKGMLLGLLLVRSRERKAVSLETIEHVVRFIRLASHDVHVDHELARIKIISELPGSFIPSQLRAVFSQREGVPAALHPRLDDLAHAVEALARSFSLLDRGEPDTRVLAEPTVPDTTPVGPKKPPSKITRFHPRAPVWASPESISAGADAPDATFIYGAAFQISTELQVSIATAAEAVDDRLPMAESLILEPSPSSSAIQRTNTALRLRSDVRQGFWARVQWDALSPAEMRQTVERLKEELTGLQTEPDATSHEALTLGFLSASTGLARARCHSIRTNSGDGDTDSHDLLDIELGKLSLPLVAREDRYHPKPEQLPLLRPVQNAVSIYLPQEVTAELRRLLPADDGYVFRTDLATLNGFLTDLFHGARDDEPRITAARIFRGHQLEVLAQCGDPPSAQMLTGQTLGTAPVGLSYYTAQPKALQAIYDRAVVNHGMTPSECVDSTTHLVGSKLVLTGEAIVSAVEAISRGLVNRPRDSRTEGDELLLMHDALVRATACIWMAGTGFRPTFRLGEVHASHINWISNTAVIVDKLTDAAHEGRLVPLAPTLMRSLGAYGEILDLIWKAKELSASVRFAARQALTSEGPLFFVLDAQGVAQPIEASLALSRLPRGWNLPANFFRHRIATRLREVGCAGIYVQALLGHLEQGIHPFGPESFMVPAEYLQATRDGIERVLQEDGWRPLLGGFGDSRIFIGYALPADKRVRRIEAACDAAAKDAFKRQRQEVEALQESRGDEIRAEVLELVQLTRPELLTDPTQPHELDSAAITALRLGVCAGAASAAIVELRVRALREFLLHGRRDHGWKIKRLPQFFALQPTSAVHHPTLMPAHMTLERLRAHFSSHLNDAGQAVLTAATAKLHLVMALVLWHGVSSWQRLARIFQGLGEAAPISSEGEGIAIPIVIPCFSGDPAPEVSAEVLFGAVALAALGAIPHVETADLNELEELIATWVPPALVKPGKGRMLDVLFALARIGHRFESPAPLRLVWSEEIISVTMPVERIRALMGHLIVPSQSADSTSIADSGVVQNRNVKGKGDNAARYKWLKATLRAAEYGEKPFPPDPFAPFPAEPDESRTARAKRATPSRKRLRQEACRRLRARLSDWPQDGSLVRALTDYAYDRIEHGTPWSPEIGSDTVYTYVGGAGSALLNWDPDMCLTDLDEEEFAEMYAGCIRKASRKYRKKLTAYLAYFHGYLVSKRLAPRVSIGSSRDEVISLPDVGYVAPNEVAASVAQLRAELAAADEAGIPLAEMRAAQAVICLGFSAGSRTSETLMRESRELVTEEGRRALWIRKNRWVSTKTHLSTRLIDLEPTMPAAGWTAIDLWQSNSSALRTAREIQRSALFSDLIGGGSPIRQERLTRPIGTVLRQITKRPDARVYWWRHTAVSNDVLVLYGTSEMLAAVRRGTTSEGTDWLPDAARMLESLGGDLPLGQPHAAGFRARRGHADMHTPWSTYVHTSGLVEPWACRDVTNSLSATALAALAGLRPATLRQKLSRAAVSAIPARPAVRWLIQQQWPARAEAQNYKPCETRLPLVTASGTSNPEQLSEALFRSLRLGELGPMMEALHLPPAAVQRLSTRIGDALATNVFGLNLGIELELPVNNAVIAIPRSTRKSSDPMSFARVDQDWVRAVMQTRCEHPELATVWAIVLRGLHPRSGQIAVRTDQDFVALLTRLPAAIEQVGGSRYRVSVVVHSSLRATERARVRQIVDATASKGCPMRESSDRAPIGWAMAGVVVESSGSGRRQIAGLALLALASALLSITTNR